MNSYSPTVRSAYKTDPNWFEQYKDLNDPRYDQDGYDMYGYDVNGVDRSGNCHYDYNYDGEELYYDVCFMFKNYMPNTGGV